MINVDVAKFTMKDEEFVCEVCGKNVSKLMYSARDHCNHCLCSIHVDNNPGDRLCDCHGVLRPIDVVKWKSDNYKIIYKCDKCGMIKRNISARDDDIDMIIKVMSHEGNNI